MNEKIIIKKVTDCLHKMNWELDDNAHFIVDHQEQEQLRDGTTKEIFSVSFFSKVFEYERYHAYLDAKTLDVLYIMGPTNYIEVPKS